MATRVLLASGIVVVGIALAVVGDDRVWVGLDAGDPKLTRETANRIELALQQKTDCNFDNQPLKDVLERLASIHGIPIWIDKGALNDEGIADDWQVKLALSGVTLQAALNLILGPHGLTHLTEDGVLKVTTQSKADERMSTRVYPVADLVDRGTFEKDYDPLMTLIEKLGGTKWMEYDGEGGSIDAFPNARSLVIRQTQQEHRAIEGLLAALRKAKWLQRIDSIPVNADESDILNPIEPSAANPRPQKRPSLPSQAWQRPQIHPAE